MEKTIHYKITIIILVGYIIFSTIYFCCLLKDKPEVKGEDVIIMYNTSNEYTITETEKQGNTETKTTERICLEDIEWVANRNIDISPTEYFIFARLVYLENGKWNGYECTYLTASVVVNRLAEYGSFKSVAYADNQYSTAYDIFNSFDMNEQTISAVEDAYNNPVEGIYYQCMGHLFDDYYELYKEVDGECFYYGGE